MNAQDSPRSELLKSTAHLQIADVCMKKPHGNKCTWSGLCLLVYCHRAEAK